MAASGTAFPFPTNTRQELAAVSVDTSVSGAVSGGPKTFDVNIPTGMVLRSVYIQTSANNKQVTITSIVPYADKNHYILDSESGNKVFMIHAGTSACTTTYTLAATATGVKGAVYSVLGAKSAIVTPTGHRAPYGYQLTVTCTASGGAGNYYIGFVATGS